MVLLGYGLANLPKHVWYMGDVSNVYNRDMHAGSQEGRQADRQTDTK